MTPLSMGTMDPMINDVVTQIFKVSALVDVNMFYTRALLRLKRTMNLLCHYRGREGGRGRREIICCVTRGEGWRGRRER